MEKEIKKIILTSDIKSYINFMIIIKDQSSKLYDIYFQKIGRFINLHNNKKIEILKENAHPYIKRMYEEDDIVQAILACLVNIKEIKDYIPNGKNLIRSDSFLFHFFQILRIMWSYKKKYMDKNVKEYIGIFDSFMFQLKDFSFTPNINIFKDLKLLVNIIIMNLQKEFYKLDYHEEFIYEDGILLNQAKLNILNNNKTLLQDLFFFRMKISQMHKVKKEIENIDEYYLKYFLEFDIKEDDKSSIDIIKLFKKLEEEKIKLENKEEMIIKRKLISLPKYLIIIINNKTKNKTLKSFLKKTINIKEFCGK